MSVKRIYVVSARGTEWLVEATTGAQAIRHVTIPYGVRLASQADLVRLIKLGIEVEKASEAPKEQG